MDLTKQKRIELATNAVRAMMANSLSESMVARQRMAAAGYAPMDAKRPQAWLEYGWPTNIEPSMLYSLYRRGGLAHGAVNKLHGECWSTDPWVIQGEEKDESTAETAWEKSVKAELTSKIWRAFAEADKRRLVCRYSAVLLHINDGKDWNEPVVRGKKLIKATPAWQAAIEPYRFDANEKSETYGRPIEWTYKEAAQKGRSGRRVKIHPDRIFILGDYSEDAIGFLEAAYNNFVNIEKVEGGSGESFLKNAARQMNVNFDKEIDFKGLASAYGLEDEDIHTVLNEAARDINSANDLLMITQGATVTPLVSNVPDPQSTYNVNLQSLCSAIDIPSRVLVGNQQGERASTEDNKYFKGRCQSRRVRELSPEIEDFVDHLTNIGVIKAVNDKTVMWDDLNAQTATEKLDSAVKMTQVNQGSLAIGEPVFYVNEIRSAAGYEAEDIEPLGEEDEFEDIEE